MRQAAVIDIGSNSIRYACGSLLNGRLQMEKKQVETTRLVQGMQPGGNLEEVPMMRTLWAVERFAADAREKDIPIYAYATSAVRDSANRAAFCRRVEELGVEMEILSGEEEASLALLGASGGRGGLLDIGGGSTELLRGDFVYSAPIGCVRGRDMCMEAHDLEGMRRIIFTRCRDCLRFPPEKRCV